MQIKLGANVRQIIKAIEGVVAERRFDDQSDSFSYRVVTTDEDGTQHDRWFAQSAIEIMGETE